MAFEHEGEWIRHWREHQIPRMNQEELSARLRELGVHVSRSAIAQYEALHNRPRPRTLRAMERLFGSEYPQSFEEVATGGFAVVSPEDTFTNTGHKGTWGRLPFWGTIPRHASTDVVLRMVEVKAELVRNDAGTYKVAGDSLLPEFKAGDRLFVEPTGGPIPGAFNLCHDETNVVTARWVEHTADGLMVYDMARNPVGPASAYTFSHRVYHMDRTYDAD